MRTVAVLLPATLSLWLLGAHALRAENEGLALAWGLVPALFFLRHAWVRRAAQLALGAGMLLWADIGGTLVRLRLGLEQPWTRLALIIGAVMALAAWAVALLESRNALRWFDGEAGKGADAPAIVQDDAAGTASASASVTTHTPSRATVPAWAPACAFILTAAMLALTRSKVSFPILLPDRFLPGSGWVLILLLAVYAALAVRWFLAPGRSPRDWSKGRIRVWGLFSAVFFTQLALGLAGAERLLMTGKLHLPVPALIMAGPIYRGEGFFMPILFLGTIAFVGPAWCSWLCYIGAWDGLAARQLKRPAAMPRWRQPVRVALAALVALTAWGLRASGTPVSTALVLAAGFGLLGVALMLFISRRKGVMIHCTAFCPIGVLANFLGRLNPFRVRIREGCTGCGVCARICRYDALDGARIEQGMPGVTCTLCGDCVGSCPHGAMHYVFPGLAHAHARALFTVLAVSAHAVFLGVARI